MPLQPFVRLDSLPQSYGLSLPTVTQERIGAMPAIACRLGENSKSHFLTEIMAYPADALSEDRRHQRPTASNKI
jgi:hypothetical protein